MGECAAPKPVAVFGASLNQKSPGFVQKVATIATHLLAIAPKVLHTTQYCAFRSGSVPAIVCCKKGALMRWILACSLFLVPVSLFAQTHPCDLTAPTSGTAVSGEAKQLVHCHPGTDPNGNPVTGFALYDNGTRSTVPMVKGSTANKAGQFEFASPFTVPKTGGVHTIETAALSSTFESPKSSPFALTVSLPPVAPVAPTHPQIR